MGTPAPASIELRLQDVDPAIGDANWQKLRVRLSANDFREQNLDAFGALPPIRLKLIQRLSGRQPGGGDLVPPPARRTACGEVRCRQSSNWPPHAFRGLTATPLQ